MTFINKLSIIISKNNCIEKIPLRNWIKTVKSILYGLQLNPITWLQLLTILYKNKFLFFTTSNV